jgi:hypothetical protein
VLYDLAHVRVTSRVFRLLDAFSSAYPRGIWPSGEHY